MLSLFIKPPLATKSKTVVRDFVYGCWCNGRRVGGMQMPPLNDLYVATHARNIGLDVLFLDAQLEPERWTAMKEHELADIAHVILLSSTQSFEEDCRFLGELKAINHGIRGILFGSHPTFMPTYCLSNPAVDYIVLREPEESIRQLLLCLRDKGDPASIQGIGFRNANGECVITEPRPFMRMDDLPIPDRNLLPARVDYFNPVIWQVPYTTMQTSRGCPGKCIFCTAPEFYGRKVRFRSTENVMAELREIKRLGFKEVFFRDETFTAYKKRNMEVCRAMIEEKLDLTWVANGRVDLVDRDSMAMMKRAGCHLLKFGVETGNDEILRNYCKDTTIAQARQAFSDAAGVGLDTHAHIVLGGPGETPETLAKTLAFVKELNPTTASFGLLTPYAGTELFRRVEEKHPEIRDGSASNMANLHVDGFFSESICGIDGKTLNAWLLRYYRSFYVRPSYLFRRLLGIRNLNQAMILFIAGLNIFKFAFFGEGEELLGGLVELQQTRLLCR